MNGAVPKRAALKTLGCKLNQYESEQIREQLQRRGYEIVPFESVADLYVVNSCTVTSRTDRDCRRFLRGARARNRDALVVVTGCYAEVAPNRLAQMDAVDLVVGNADKQRLAELVPPGGPACETPDTGQLVSEFAGHTRAFVKVQEGCDARCAYCIIPYARGPSRSTPPGKVLAQAELLISAGHPELVLIGTHLGKYGDDLADDTDLAGLCVKLCSLDELGRLRLSSIEPRELPDCIIELVAAGGNALPPDPSLPGQGKLCRHLHIPLQSGCDSVLGRMRRPYDTAFYADLVGRIKVAQPRICIGADVMVGFPGESEDEFEQTHEFLQSLPLSYLHVFTYSPRPGTAAAEMPEQVPGHVKKRRNHILRELSERKRQAFGEALVGEELEVVVERFAPQGPGLLRGVSDNYMQVIFAGPEELMGQIVAVAVKERKEGKLVGLLA